MKQAHSISVITISWKCWKTPSLQISTNEHEDFSIMPGMEVFITGCQQSCGKVMFSVVSISVSTGGSHVTITRDPLDLTTQRLSPPPSVLGPDPNPLCIALSLWSLYCRKLVVSIGLKYLLVSIWIQSVFVLRDIDMHRRRRLISSATIVAPIYSLSCCNSKHIAQNTTVCYPFEGHFN